MLYAKYYAKCNNQFDIHVHFVTSIQFAKEDNKKITYYISGTTNKELHDSGDQRKLTDLARITISKIEIKSLTVQLNIRYISDNESCNEKRKKISHLHNDLNRAISVIMNGRIIEGRMKYSSAKKTKFFFPMGDRFSMSVRTTISIHPFLLYAHFVEGL